MPTICLITSGQPSTNPRLVKEADALTEAGYSVRVVCAHWTAWADATDEVMLVPRSWKTAVRYVGGELAWHDPRYLWSRGRHGLSVRLSRMARLNGELQNWTLCRVLPELARAAKERRADLYVAHNLGALPAAVRAAQQNEAYVGFDAEDFHSGLSHTDDWATRAAEKVERQFLPHCNYITAASPGIALAYEGKYAIPTPAPILNVFPLADRPSVLRASQSDQPLSLYWFSQTIGADRGLEDVVRAMGHLKGLKIELHLRGQWQNHYRNQLFELASALGVGPEQIVSHGMDSADEMTRLASQFDIGLALEPGHSVNSDICISNKIFTYLLAGCGVIATATSGQRSIVEQVGAAGFLYEPGDFQALAKGIKSWYDDRSTLMAARCEAWDWGTRKYNWDLEKRKFLAVVENTLALVETSKKQRVAQ